MYVVAHEPSNAVAVAEIIKQCSTQLLHSRRNFFSVVVEVQQVYDPIACATSAISRPRPLAGAAEKAAAALFCTHVCLLVILKWRLFICYNRVRRQRLQVALTFFAISHQSTFVKGWRRLAWASKAADRFRSVVLTARALRYERKTLSSLQAYAVSSRILSSKFEVVRIAHRISGQAKRFQLVVLFQAPGHTPLPAALLPTPATVSL
jgi:hypothetical protein